MNVALWAEIRRLSEIERLSQRVIAQRLRCSRRTVKRALAMDRSPATAVRLARGSLLDRYRPQIDALLAKYPKLSAVRILEELRRGPEGYRCQSRIPVMDSLSLLHHGGSAIFMIGILP